MKLAICTKFQVNRMNCVESRRGGVRLTPPSMLIVSFFFYKASRVNLCKSFMFHNSYLIINFALSYSREMFSINAESVCKLS